MLAGSFIAVIVLWSLKIIIMASIGGLIAGIIAGGAQSTTTSTQQTGSHQQRGTPGPESKQPAPPRGSGNPQPQQPPRGSRQPQQTTQGTQSPRQPPQNNQPRSHTGGGQRSNSQSGGRQQSSSGHARRGSPQGGGSKNRENTDRCPNCRRPVDSEDRVCDFCEAPLSR